MLKKNFRRMSECRAWEPETEQRDRQNGSTRKSLLCLASEVYNNSVPDSVPSRNNKFAVVMEGIADITGKHIKSLLCIVSFILLNHTVKSFQAVQIKMGL